MQYVEGLNGVPVTAAYPHLQQKRHESCGLTSARGTISRRG